MIRLISILLSFYLIYGKAVDFDEKSQLLELKKGFLDPRGILSSWKSRNNNHCLWFGVTCNSRGRVSEIRVSGGNNNFAYSGSYLSNKYTNSFHNVSEVRKKGYLGGRLLNVIGEFIELKVLSVPFNRFTGELPNGIWGLKNLEVIDIEGNFMTANLSVIDFVSLRNLKVVNLGFNRLFGEIPKSLSKCKDLAFLNLAGNRIGGSVPDFVGRFVKLKGINLSLNRFNGSIGDEFWSSCDVLELVDFSGNLLSGVIPKSFGKCSNLRTMLLFSNRFSGGLPLELGNLRVLEVLDVSRNRLVGVIPTSIGNCVKLSVLVLSSDFNEHHKHGLIKDGNYFASSIPLQITMLPNLEIIWAPNANLVGEFPKNWGECRALKMVNLGDNNLKGQIFGVFNNCPNLHYLNVRSNKISGVLDEKLGVRCMTLFDVSKNLMSGHIPDFNITPCHRSSLSQESDHIEAYLSYFAHRTRVQNHLHISRFTPAMIHDFSENNFTGSIPMLIELEYKTIFIFLNVSNNIISGGILPNVSVNWECMKFLDASNNKISGEIPKSLVNLKNLTVLLLNNNSLSGEVPSRSLHFKYRVKFNFSFNNLSGTINHDSVNCQNYNGNPLLHHCQYVALSSLPSQEPSGRDLNSLNSTVSSESNGGKKGVNSFEIVLIIVPSIIVIILVALVIIFLCRRNRKPTSVIALSSSRPHLPPRPRNEQEALVVFKEVGVNLTLGTVVQATGNFTLKNCIGSGGFGSTYRAEISSGLTVAVKRLTVEMCQGLIQFNA